MLLLSLLVFQGTLHLSLVEAKRIALKNGPHFLEAGAKLDRSKVNLLEKTSLLLPTPSATGSYMMTIYDDTETETYDGNLQISQPLFDLPLFTQIKALHYQYQIDKALFKNSFQEILFKVEVAYLNLIRAQEILKSSEITLKRTRENERLTLEKYRLGVASKLDKLQAEVSALQAEKGLSQARRSFFEAQSELKVYLQINEDILPVDSLKIEDDFLIPPLDSLFKILEATNLNLKAAHTAERVAHMNRLSSYFKFLPRISLFFRYGYSNDKFPQNLNEFKADDSRAYGINFDLPIFNLKDLYFSNLLARIDYKHQKYMYQRTLAETKQALITNILSLNEIKDRLRLAQKSLELAEEAANIAQERYRLGAASIIDLLSSEENLYRARVDYIGAQVDLKIEQTKFLYFLGELEVK